MQIIQDWPSDCISILGMIKKLWGLCSIYILTILNSKGSFYSDHQWAYLNIEEIFIVIHRKTVFPPTGLIFFLSFFKLPKIEGTCVEYKNVMWHLTFWDLFSNSFIQRIAWLPLNSCDVSLHIKQSYTFHYTMRLWDLEHKQKLNGEVNAL